MSDAESSGEGVFDVDRIRRLVELMEQHDLREVDLKQSGQRIRLSRGAEPVAFLPPAAMRAAAPAASAAASSAPADLPAVDEAHVVTIRSPMVGTYYARANPGAQPYVKVGDFVEPETTVCIIEAMKVFNEIPAEVRGRVVAVLVDDEEPVEFNKPLFKVDTSVKG